MEFTQVYTRPKKNFIWQVIVIEHKGRPCKMCDSVRQNLGHTMKPIEILSLSTLILPQGILILSLYEPINTEMGEPSGTTDFLVFVDLGQFSQSS